MTQISQSMKTKPNRLSTMLKLQGCLLLFVSNPVIIEMMNGSIFASHFGMKTRPLPFVASAAVLKSKFESHKNREGGEGEISKNVQAVEKRDRGEDKHSFPLDDGMERLKKVSRPLRGSISEDNDSAGMLSEVKDVVGLGLAQTVKYQNTQDSIVDSQNDIEQAIVDSQNEIKQAIVDSQNANGQAITDAQNASTAQRNSMISYIHENFCVIHEALGSGTCQEDSIRPIGEGQTFTPLALHSLEGKPNMMEELQHLETKGERVHEAMDGIQKALDAGVGHRGERKIGVEGHHSVVAVGTEVDALEAIKVQVGTMEGIVVEMDSKVGSMEGNMKAVESNMGIIEGKVDTIEGSIENMSGKVHAIEAKMDEMMKMMSQLMEMMQ